MIQNLCLPNGQVLAISTSRVEFRPWRQTWHGNSYGGKAIIDSDGDPLFAELAALKLQQREGWDGVWVDSYRKAFRVGMPDRTVTSALPVVAQALFDRLVHRVAVDGLPFGGCWDLFLWKGRQWRFIELKRLSRDRIQPSQLLWLEAALQEGLRPADFLIIEWVLETSKRPSSTPS